VLAGDMTVGPLQAETLDLLDSLGEKAIWVRGNCERAVVEVRRTPYDLDKAAERLRTSAWPGTAGFVEENILHGPPSDTEALELLRLG
jgi:predicted phosphodiesterase